MLLAFDPAPEFFVLQTFLISTGVVAFAELGDKTQLLAMVLAARFDKPLPIIAGIFVATIANHVLAAIGGYYLASFLTGQMFQIAIALSFITMAFWILIPDKLDSDEAKPPSHMGAFLATVVAFFLAEIGDKTQIATVALAAQFHDIFVVAAGTTTGMMIANVPAVLVAGTVLKRIPMNYIRVCATVIFVSIGIWDLVKVLRDMGYL